MKKYFLLISIFSLFLVQIHEVVHSDFSESDIDHHCAICKISYDQDGLTPRTIDLNLSYNLALIKIFIITNSNFVSKSFISKIINPRAPPIA